MIAHQFVRMREALPLAVTRIEANDPFLCLVGENWSLALNRPWTLKTPEEMIPWESDRFEREAEKLVGRSLVAVSEENPGVSDLTCHFTAGYSALAPHPEGNPLT